jgi:hypothetical protein
MCQVSYVNFFSNDFGCKFERSHSMGAFAHCPSCEQKGTSFGHDLYGHNQAYSKFNQTSLSTFDRGF